MPEQLFKSYALVGDADNLCTLDKDEFEDEVEAEWYSAAVPRKEMKALMKRTNREATFHFILWGLLLIGSGVGAVLTWGTWWTVPFLMLYGIMYSMSDHQAHELSHGTPFRIRWLNDFLYWVNGFMTLHETYYWRWSHTRHHTDTLHVGRDPEIAVMAPADLARLILDFVFLVSGLKMLMLIFKHSFGKIEGDGGPLHSGLRAAQGDLEFARLCCDHGGYSGRRRDLAKLAAGPAGGHASLLWRLLSSVLQHHPARGT